MRLTTKVRRGCDAAGRRVAVRPGPTPRHADVLADLLRPLGAGGNLVSDGHLAALAVEHRASIVSYASDFGRFDADFGRFGGVRRQRPDDLLG